MVNKIAVIGECMIELTEKDHVTKRSFGGDSLNTAVYVSRLTPKSLCSVYYVTALGTDIFSQEMIDAWKNENVETNLVQRMDNKMPGLYAIVTDDKGERSFYYWRNDAAARFWLKTDRTEEVCKQIEDFNYIYLSGISLAILDTESITRLIELLKRFKEKGGKVIFDNNYRPRLWSTPKATQDVYSRVLAFTHTAFLTLDDEDALWGKLPVDDVIARTKKLGVSEIVIKRGAESCIIDAPEGRFDVPAIKVEKVIDTTSAGDSFSAGYISARLRGLGIEESAKQAHIVAGTVIQYRGAIIPKDAMPKF